jgi:hypothetical protein
MYSSLINPFTVVIAFCLALIALNLLKPEAGRITLGIFFLVMALGVNLTLLLTDPSLYVAAGKDAFLPVYRWFFTTVLAWNPVFFVILLILYEVSVGALILSKGKYVRYGLVGGIVFCLGVSLIGIQAVTSPGVALALALLLRKDFPHSLPEMLAAAFRTRAAKNA